MQNTIKIAISAGFLMSVALVPHPAKADEALAVKSGCTVCHTIDKPLVGPPFKNIAAKYKGDAAAMDKLTAKVRNGGVGVWGEIPMFPNPVISDEDIKTLVKWILSM